ncbi:MAG: DUF6152 family protein [Candidatus Rariloculaceae bacterium]
MKSIYRILLPSSLLSLLIGFPVAAHHNGATYFDTSVSIEHVNATVVAYEIVNPHGRLVFSFNDESGEVVEWSGELASANNLRRRGLGGEIFQPGDELASVSGSPSRSGANFMRLERVVFANGDVAQLTGRDAGITRAGAE